jgi:hypothetical protein
MTQRVGRCSNTRLKQAELSLPAVVGRTVCEVEALRASRNYQVPKVFAYLRLARSQTEQAAVREINQNAGVRRL